MKPRIQRSPGNNFLHAKNQTRWKVNWCMKQKSDPEDPEDREDPDDPEDPGNSEDCLPDDVSGAFYTAHKPWI